MGSRPVLSRRRFLVVSSSAALLAAGPCISSPAGASSTDARRVNSNGVRLRSGPGTGYGVKASLAAGTIVRYTEPAGWANGYDWTACMVETTDVWGYVASTFLSPLDDPGRPVVQVASGPLRVRSAPGLSSSVLGSMPVGSRGTITTSMPQETDGYVWVNVQFTHGPRGWVAAAFLTWL